jgi:hypothetical protein
MAGDADAFALVEAVIGRLQLFVADRRRVVEEWETIPVLARPASAPPP